MPRPSQKVKEDPEIDDEFANPPVAEAADEIAGESPRTLPRILARTPASGNTGGLSPEELRKQRLRKRVKAPRQDKDQLNDRVPIFLIDGVRDYGDKYGITEIGESMTEIIEAGLQVLDPDIAPTAYADRCAETGFETDRTIAKKRYTSGESQ